MLSFFDVDYCVSHCIFFSTVGSAGSVNAELCGPDGENDCIWACDSTFLCAFVFVFVYFLF